MRRTPRFSVFASLALVFLVVPLARAEISHLAVSVDGLGCPFCVYGIEKKLKEVEGVRNVETNLKAGLATLVLADGAAPDFGKVETAVKKAGFTPRNITLTAIGSPTIEEGKILFTVRGSGQRYLLYEKGSDSREVFDAATQKQLTEWAEHGTLIAVTGTVHTHAEHPPGLSTDRMEPLSFLTLTVEGMQCEQCAERLTRLLQETTGVYRAAVDVAKQRATVESIGQTLDAAPVIAVIEDAGFTATLSPGGTDQ